MAQMREYKEVYNNEQYKRRLRVTKENSRAGQGAWKDGASDGQQMIHASLHISNKQPGESISSKLRDLDMRIQKNQNSPMSDVANAKWLADQAHVYR